MNPFYRLSDGELLNWSTNLSQKLTQSPSEFHITPEMAEEFELLVLQFNEELNAWNDPATRTPIASAAKKSAREQLLGRAKYLVKSINSNPETTDTQRDELRIKARKKARPIALPDDVPVVAVERMAGRWVTIQLNGGRRARPSGSRGAVVFTFEGDELPVESSSWKMQCMTTKSSVEIDFGNSTQANTFWISARWYNARGMGAACAPVRVNLPAGMVVPVAMRAAA